MKGEWWSKNFSVGVGGHFKKKVEWGGVPLNFQEGGGGLKKFSVMGVGV